MTSKELLIAYIDLMASNKIEAAQKLRKENQHNEEFERLCCLREKMLPAFKAFARKNQDSLQSAMTESDPKIRMAMLESWGNNMAETVIEDLGKNDD